MTKIAVSIERLGKRFQIGSDAPYRRITEALLRSSKKFLGRVSSLSVETQRKTSQELWAIQDVSFDVPQGTVLGIIGRNGAGKSTLLKVLARITEPTSGRFGIRGRVGSLLEVGTGFHPELTGRENIFLSGTLLGMSRNEVRRRFDDIVEFAETDQFLDTPVKRYSSGMRVRLGFAVAAHLDPEILIVDEVLAVGDHVFQQKCMGKMSQFASDGRTILFVSHNMAAIQSLCTDAVLLDSGRLTDRGSVNDCVATYLRTQRSRSETDIAERSDRFGNGRIRIQRVEVFGDGPNRVVVVGGRTHVRLTLSITDLEYPGERSKKFQVAVVIRDNSGQVWTTLHSRFTGNQLAIQGLTTIVECEVPHLPLSQGHYLISLQINSNGDLCDVVDDAAALVICESDFYGTGQVPTASKHGRVVTQHEFRVVPDTNKDVRY